MKYKKYYKIRIRYLLQRYCSLSKMTCLDHAQDKVACREA